MKAKTNKLKIAVFVSGSGTNLQALIDRVETGKLDAEIMLVVSNNPQAYGLVRAEKHGIATAVVDYEKYGKKLLPEIDENALPKEFDEVINRQRIYSNLPPAEVRNRLARLVLAEQEILRLLEPLNPDLVCLAGFMRLISPYLIGQYCAAGRYRLVNIHPALLPAFPGTRGYEDTFEYGCRFGGITVHFVDEGEDTGPIIAQALYPIWPEDTVDELRRRGLELEYILLPQCIQWIAEGNVQVEQGKHRRPQVSILDPQYPQFIEQLTQQAFAR